MSYTEISMEPAAATSKTAVALVAALNQKLSERPAIGQQVISALDAGGALWDLEWAATEERSEQMAAFADRLGLSRDELSLMMRALDLARRKRASYQA